MMNAKIYLASGNHFTTRINASEQFIREYYPIGGSINVGIGPNDNHDIIIKVDVW